MTPGSFNPPPKRSVVLHPRTAAARRQDRARSFGGHVRGYTVDVDEVLELMRRQRRLSIAYLSVVLGPLLGFLAAMRAWPAIGTARTLLSIPLAWLVLGPIVLFTIVGVAFLHERSANAIERRWTEEHR